MNPRMISKFIRPASIAIAVLAATVSLASRTLAYETGFGPVQLVAAAQTADSASCPAANVQASIVRPRAPEYPQISLEQGVGGISLISFALAPDGALSEVKIADTSGNRLLDEAALDAIRQSRFVPTVQSCASVGGTYTVPVVFSQADTAQANGVFTGGGGGTSRSIPRT